MTTNELYASAFISYVYLYFLRYKKWPQQYDNRVECYEWPGENHNFKLEKPMNWEEIVIRDTTSSSYLIENYGRMEHHRFVVRHQERSNDITFEVEYGSRFKISSKTRVYYAELLSMDEVRIEAVYHPKGKFNFRFS